MLSATTGSFDEVRGHQKYDPMRDCFEVSYTTYPSPSISSFLKFSFTAQKFRRKGTAASARAAPAAAEAAAAPGAGPVRARPRGSPIKRGLYLNW